MKSKVLCSMALLIAVVLILTQRNNPISNSQAEEPVSPPAEVLAIDPAEPGEYDPHDSRFLMHEWGTFTSFSGSDGVKLEFRPLANNDLPPFVFDRPRQAGIIPFSRLLSKQAFVSWQRMETPVIYFYTPNEMDVQVKVAFPEGLLTEFYPPVKSFLPEMTETETNLARLGPPNARALGDMDRVSRELQSQLKNSELDWGTITLVPPSSLKLPLKNEVAAQGIHERMLRKLVPRTPQDFDYYYARETDSSYIHIDFPANKDVLTNAYKPLGAFFEKFLFYRGIGNFDLLLRLQAKGNDQFVVKNLSSLPVHSLILLERTREGGLRFVVQEVLEGKKQLELQLPDTDMSQGDLEAAVEVALVNAGLFRKEALAMIATWRSSWFGETGTRMFYLLPTAQTERLLPLKIQPAPEESVRVMVGRLEIMTPDREQKIESLLKAQAIDTTKLVDPATELGVELASLGRFAEPALTRILKSSKDEAIRLNAGRLIKLLADGPEPPKAEEGNEEVKTETSPLTDFAPDDAQTDAESDSN